MNDRRIAILIDGGFFLKRLPSLVQPARCDTPDQIVRSIRSLIRSHIKQLTGSEQDGERWDRHVYRSFYYDANPYDGKAHHPIDNRSIDFAKSDVARHRREIFKLLRKQPKLALRLGKVIKEGDWTISPSLTKKILRSRHLVAALDKLGTLPPTGPDSFNFTDQEIKSLQELRDFWKGIEGGAVALGLRQKGVDMRIGLDISTLTLKKQVDTIVLVAGDSDFVPAAKLARREGINFILDPLWQKVNDDLFEHIDGLQSGFPNPRTSSAVSSPAGLISAPGTTISLLSPTQDSSTTTIPTPPQTPEI